MFDGATFYRYGHAQKTSPPVGLEPTIFGLEVQRVIHYATRAATVILHDRNSQPQLFFSTTKIIFRKTTPRGFEPLRAEPNGFLVHLLNHSDTVSLKINLALRPNSSLP